MNVTQAHQVAVKELAKNDAAESVVVAFTFKASGLDAGLQVHRNGCMEVLKGWDGEKWVA